MEKHEEVFKELHKEKEKVIRKAKRALLEA
jgi:hypothetical protein